MTIKQFSEKYHVGYNDIYKGLTEFTEMPYRFEKNVQYDEEVMFLATKQFLIDRINRLEERKLDLMAKLDSLYEAH